MQQQEKLHTCKSEDPFGDFFDRLSLDSCNFLKKNKKYLLNLIFIFSSCRFSLCSTNCFYVITIIPSGRAGCFRMFFPFLFFWGSCIIIIIIICTDVIISPFFSLLSFLLVFLSPFSVIAFIYITRNVYIFFSLKTQDIVRCENSVSLGTREI